MVKSLKSEKMKIFSTHKADDLLIHQHWIAEYFQMQQMH